MGAFCPRHTGPLSSAWGADLVYGSVRDLWGAPLELDRMILNADVRMAMPSAMTLAAIGMISIPLSQLDYRPA